MPDKSPVVMPEISQHPRPEIRFRKGGLLESCASEESFPFCAPLIWTLKISHLFAFSFSISLSLCRVSAHWLQREACQPADVHWNSR